MLYALTILVSAFLLFQVQPIIAKIILPWFGGSAAVWTTCLLFFQIVLLLGYVYAHWLHSRLRPRAQIFTHLALLAASLWMLPILPAASWKPSGGEDPTWRILLLLGATVGLPYFLLSTTGPLVQAWYSRTRPGAVPYRLYALSNVGSLFALLSYPVLLEPHLATRSQALGWSSGYAVFVSLCAVAAISVRNVSEKLVWQQAADAPPGWTVRALWVALPASASLSLLAITNHLSQNVAAIPFLWVLPLSLYLLSFILCFDNPQWYRRDLYLRLLAVSLGSMAYALSTDFENASVKILIPLFGAGLFVCCMTCHGELTRLKPSPRYLTSFYLMIALGGALGGVFVALIAPHLFRGYFELPIGLALCALLVVWVLYREPAGPGRSGWRSPLVRVGAFLALGLIVYLAIEVRQATSDVRLMVRNFYGGLRIKEQGDPGSADEIRKLLHGTIDHGEQFLRPERRRWPTSYYGPNTGVALAIQEAETRGPVRVGVIGLGAGTLAAYGRSGDEYRFYEINPLVLQLARTQFTYLADTKAHVAIAMGDARLSLEREAHDDFDVLAVDAFSSDSIPIHLLTREAFALYFRELKPGGALAVHVSNKYLNLQPVVHLAAQALQKEDRTVDTEENEETGTFSTTWVLVTARPSLFESPQLRAAVSPVQTRTGVRIWTDDYSNLFEFLK